MTQENKIWHSPLEKPKDFESIIFTIPNGLYVGHYDSDGFFVDDESSTLFEPETIIQWAYVSDLIASSKALEVAIRALKEIIPEHEGFLDNEMYACSGIASRALLKIKEIMKGV